MFPYFNVFGRQFSTYGLMLVLAVFLVVVLSVSVGKKRGVCLYDVCIIAAFTVLFGLFGASLLYALVTYSLAEIWHYIITGNIEPIGGLVYYGGFIGGFLGALLGIKVSKVSIAEAERTIVPFLPLGHAIGRIGCFLAGCCVGMKYDGPFAVYYPHISDGYGRFPVQLLESIVNLGICCILLSYARQKHKPFAVISLYCIMYGICRFFLELLRGDSIRGIAYGFSTSQWISIGMIVISAGYLISLRIAKRHLLE